jgi:ABC-type antimicrobial peptide transport system permease subunit
MAAPDSTGVPGDPAGGGGCDRQRGGYRGLSGVIGVTALTVSRSIPEIGLRVAIGATAPSEVRRLTAMVGARIAVGGAIGVLLCGIGRQTLIPLLFGVNAMDPLTVVGSVCVVGGACLASAYVISRRATRVDPVASLRRL